MRARQARTAGFTLTELAVVLAIVGLLLGSLMYTLSAQVEQRAFDDTRRRLEQARELILTFAITNGRMPCPARYTSSASHSSGLESFCTSYATSSGFTCAGSETTTKPTAPVEYGTCSNHWDGYVPGATLGSMQTDTDGFPVDAWGNRLRYVVSRINTSCAGSQTPAADNLSPPAGTVAAMYGTFTTLFTSKYFLQRYGVSCQPDDLIVCKTATGISGTDCASATDRIMAPSTVVAIVYSTGKNYALNTGGSGADEQANLDANRVFVWHTPTDTTATNGEFDDQMTWIPVWELYGRLVSAGQLP